VRGLVRQSSQLAPPGLSPVIDVDVIDVQVRSLVTCQGCRCRVETTHVTPRGNNGGGNRALPPTLVARGLLPAASMRINQVRGTAATITWRVSPFHIPRSHCRSTR
jgi:hypothetical protein